jgi:ribose transport system substrate-binding protein
MSVKSKLGRLALAIVLVLGLVAVGCGSDEKKSGSGGQSDSAASPAKPKKVIAFVFGPRGFNDVTKAWFNGFDAAAQSLGGKVDLEVKGMGKLEPEAAPYLNFIRQALVTKPDGIVVVPNNGTAMKSGLEQIASQGTKVLIMDQDVPDMNGKVSFVGTDNRNAGKQGADYLIKQFESGKMKSNKVAVLGSAPGVTSTDDRLAGFLDAIKGSPLKVVAKRAPKCEDGTKGRSTMADVLSANPDLGGVYSVCDIIALGAAQALKAADRLDVQHVSVDASTAGVKAIQSKAGINAEIAQHLLKAGQLSVETLVKALQGEQVPPQVDTGTTLVTDANAAEYLQTASEESK